MTIRWPAVALAAVAFVVLLLVVRGCDGGGAREEDEVRTESTAAPAVPASAAPDAATVAASAANAERLRQRDEALRAAVEVVQRYLAALGGDDRAAADAFWVDGRVPAASGEADLRALSGLRGLRIENGTPRPLDRETPPTALEVPVRLRAGLAVGGVQRYAGWYRVRRRVADGGWEISGASITRAPPVQ